MESVPRAFSLVGERLNSLVMVGFAVAALPSRIPAAIAEERRMTKGVSFFGSTIGKKVVMAVGNYGEIFDRNFGPNTGAGVARGQNALWSNGGLIYAPNASSNSYTCAC